jgi:hypothetical protein
MSLRRVRIACAFLLLVVLFAPAPARGATYWGPRRSPAPSLPQQVPVQPDADSDEWDAAFERLAFKAAMVVLGLVGLFKTISRLGGGND